MVRPDVIKFIHRFTDGGKNQGVISAFSYGCCYYFAEILWSRFYDPDSWHGDEVEIMYDQIVNHFGCKIDREVYDITGAVTRNYNWEPWIQVSDSALVQRIYRDCINF